MPQRAPVAPQFGQAQSRLLYTETAPASTYETTDLYLASFLKARGMRLLDIHRDGRRATFVFEDRPDRAELITGFYNDDVVRVNDFKNALQDLKAAVFNV